MAYLPCSICDDARSILFEIAIMSPFVLPGLCLPPKVDSWQFNKSPLILSTNWIAWIASTKPISNHKTCYQMGVSENGPIPPQAKASSLDFLEHMMILVHYLQSKISS